jgi:hypothetical protein
MVLLSGEPQSKLTSMRLYSVKLTGECVCVRAIVSANAEGVVCVVDGRCECLYLIDSVNHFYLWMCWRLFLL